MPDARDASDAPLPQTECNGVPVEDFDALATREGDTYRYRGDTLSVPPRLGGGLQPTADNEDCASGGVFPRVFLHRMRADAVLRITLDAPGTPIDFDTVPVASAGACGAPSPLCSDDAFYSDGTITYRSSLSVPAPSTGARRVPAGTPVYFSVSGLARGGVGGQGPFELVVTEVLPKGEGERCEETNECLDGLCDVAPGAEGVRRCRALAIARDNFCTRECTGCSPGATCVVSANCCREIERPAGATCGVFLYCGAGLSCARRPDLDAEGSLFGPVSSACAPVGAAWGACRDDGSCDPGLSCGVLAGASSVLCRPLRATGERCHAIYDACPTGESCVAEGFDACELTEQALGNACAAHESVRFEGVCRSLGSAGSPCPAGSCAEAGLVCSSPDATGTCGPPLPIGSPCTPPASCEGGACAYEWMTGPARCVARGAPGGPCRDGACDEGFCVRGTCFAGPTADGACSLSRECPGARPCVPDDDGQGGHCAEDGALGGQCRLGAPRCDDGLVCSNDVGRFALCQRRVERACRPNHKTDRCPDGRVCRATSFSAGECAEPVREREPNDRAIDAQPVALPVAIAGRSTARYHDCFAFDVARGGDLYAQVSRPAEHNFPFMLWRLSLWSLRGGVSRELGRARGGVETTGVLPRLDGLAGPSSRNPFASGLAPGRYAVCVVFENLSRPVPLDMDYVLSIAAREP